MPSPRAFVCHTSGVDSPGLTGYQNLKKLVFHDDGKALLKPGYEVSKRAEADMKIAIDVLRRFVNHTTEDLELGVAKNDCTAMNELAARYDITTLHQLLTCPLNGELKRLYTGSRVVQDRPRALKLWTKVSKVAVPVGATVESDNEDARGYARVKADAYAYLCTHHLHDYEKSKVLSDLAQAFLCAEGAAQLKLDADCMGITLHAFYKLQSEEPTKVEDEKTIEMSGVWKLKPEELPAFLAIKDCKTMLNVANWSQYHMPKEVPEPEVYTCSRPGCAFSTTTRTGLRRCAGLCSLAYKASYCTRDCQKQDWKRHRPHCARPTEQDRTLEFKQSSTGEGISVDTSGLSSVELAWAKEMQLAYAFRDKLISGSSGKEVAKFFKETEENSCGGPRTEEYFLSMAKAMTKYAASNGFQGWRQDPNPIRS